MGTTAFPSGASSSAPLFLHDARVYLAAPLTLYGMPEHARAVRYLNDAAHSHGEIRRLDGDDDPLRAFRGTTIYGDRAAYKLITTAELVRRLFHEGRLELDYASGDGAV